MQLDVQSLMVVMLINMMALSVAIPTIMGRQVSLAARHAQAALIAQMLGWACMLLSSHWQDRLMSTLAISGMSLSLALLWQSMRGWLGPRPGQQLAWGLALLTPLGYGLAFDSYPVRVGWANAGLALQMLTVCGALLWRAPLASPRWRLMMACSLAALAAATVWRGVLGAFFTAAYPTLHAPHPVNLVAALLSNLTVVLNAVGLLTAWREEAERALQTQARTDSLTGLLNRRALQEGASGLIGQARRHADAVHLLLIDLDRFKQINDSRGHEGGDRALRLFGQLLQQVLRDGDLAARWGGEEFCVLLARGGVEAGAAFDQRLRAELAQRSAAELGFVLDFSTGMATLMAAETTLQPLLERADAALYAAKAAGRSRLVTWSAVTEWPAAWPDPAPNKPAPSEPTVLS
ncbi:MAG: GGDEF domain-containing protein [Microbacteriaceae bacterium]|nr:GGDEF domain-containing protein [Burkholderiaceae bacterium]